MKQNENNLWKVGLSILLLIMIFTAHSFANFSDHRLIRVVHKQDGTIEIATDLGDASIMGSQDLVVGGGQGAFTNFLSDPIDQYYVTYFYDWTVYYGDGSNHSDFAVSGTGTPTSGSMKYSQLNSAVSNLYAYYNTLSNTGGTVVGDGINSNSFWQQMDVAGTDIGNFAGYLTSSSGSEVNLAALASVGYVDQYIYMFNTPDNAEDGIAWMDFYRQPNNGELPTVRTMADGSTIINPTNVVPLPGAFVLGLTGLVTSSVVARRKRKSFQQ